MLPLLLMTLAAPTARAAPDGCAGAVISVEVFRDAARAGERAFAALDRAGLDDARERALELVPCIGEKVPLEIAADFHRLMALAAFVEGDEQQVLAEFHAARRLVPGYQVPREVAPPGHPLQQLYEWSEDADEGTPDPTIPPIGGYIVVDGVRSAPRPSGISNIIQVFGADQALLETRYLPAGAETPRWGPLPEEIEARRRRHRLFGGTTAALTATAIGTYTASLILHRRFDSATDPGELNQLRSSTNSLYWAGVGTGAAAVTFGTVTLLTW
jgi:hypothetical protein